MLKMEYKKGECIFASGDLGDAMYSILSGRVGVYAGYGTANERLLTELEAGRYFGEMAVLDSMPRSATAIALEDSELLVVREESLNDFLTANPEAGMAILTSLSGRLRSMTGEYMDACRTIAEVVQENPQPKKTGLWAKLAHYAKLYVQLTDEAARYESRYGTRAPYVYDPYAFRKR